MRKFYIYQTEPLPAPLVGATPLDIPKDPPEPRLFMVIKEKGECSFHAKHNFYWHSAAQSPVLMTSGFWRQRFIFKSLNSLIEFEFYHATHIVDYTVKLFVWETSYD